MTLPIRTLPIVERWTCTGCGLCCWGTVFVLSDEDLAKLREQQWDKHPDFRGIPTLTRVGWRKQRYRLAKRRDGRCVFLTPEGLCRIHKEFGEPAKPLVCRMFPYQLVPMERNAYVTLRRFCPTVAAGVGRSLAEQLDTVRQLAEEGRLASAPTRPPTVIRKERRSWSDVLRVADVIERLVLDERFPYVRRLVHALEFCRLLDQCRLRKLDSRQLGQLVSLLEASSIVEAGKMFEQRRAPSRLGAMLFRQTAMEYVRLYPGLELEESWRHRARLVGMAASFAWGRGPVRGIEPGFPPTTFEALERPLGHLDPTTLDPLHTFFDTAVASKHYALLGRRHWSLVESFRALALTHAVAMWLIRLSSTGREPQPGDAIGAVGAIDRGQGDATLTGWRHQRRVAWLAGRQDLGLLIAWYAR